MLRKMGWIGLFLLSVLSFQSCKRVPITGRSQLNLVNDGELAGLSKQEYSAFLNQNRVIKYGKEAERVQRVGMNIANSVMEYLQRNRYTELANSFQWEFNYVDSKDVNAWCMPGGKVVVYSGLMPVALDDDGLAVVLGHEIAHAVARHGNERMSQQMMTQLGGVALSAAVSQKPTEVQQIFLTAYGLGSQIGVLLPYSRLHESEADKLGLVFMIGAGYNGDRAIDFWERMSKSGGAKVPEILSTHPSDATRISDLRAYLPIAKVQAGKR